MREREERGGREGGTLMLYFIENRFRDTTTAREAHPTCCTNETESVNIGSINDSASCKMKQTIIKIS